MASSFIIGFREALEAALIIGIMLAYLRSVKRQEMEKHVLLGAATAGIASVLTALAFNALSLEFTGASEQLFEGATMVVAGVLLAYMILWMAKQTSISQGIRSRVQERLEKGGNRGLFALAFFAVYREGVETMLFLAAAGFNSQEAVLLEFILGLAAAAALGYAIFEAGVRVNLKAFFIATSVLLILFAAGLFSHAAHEFSEATGTTLLQQQAWDTTAFLGGQSDAGRLARALFGYTPTPTLLEAIVYFAALLLVGGAYLKIIFSNGGHKKSA